MKDLFKKQLAKKFIAAVFLAIFLAGCPAAFVLAEGMTLQEAAAGVRYVYLPTTAVQKQYADAENGSSGRVLKVETSEVYLTLVPDDANGTAAAMKLTRQAIPCTITEGIIIEGTAKWKEPVRSALEINDVPVSVFFGNGSCLAAIPALTWWLYNGEDNIGYAYSPGRWVRELLTSRNENAWIEGQDPEYIDGGATSGRPVLGASASGSNASGGTFLQYRYSLAGAGTSSYGQAAGSGSAASHAAVRPQVPSVRISGSSAFTMAKGSTVKLRAYGLITGDYIKGWYSSSSAVRADRSTGRLEAKREGSALIQVRTVKGASDFVRVYVKKPSVRLNKSSLKLRANSRYNSLRASGLMPGDRIKGWKTSNRNVVRVSSSGKIKTGKKGNAVVYVYTKLGARAAVKVRVR